MINRGDGGSDKTATPKADVVAKVLSAIFAAAALWANLNQLPFTQRSQIQQALVAVGVLAWPAAALPWLGSRLTVKWRYLLGMSAVILGYWVQGQPLVGFTIERMLFNTKLLPYLGAADVVLLVLIAGIPRLPGNAGTGFKAWIPSCALVGALAWTLSVVVPAVAVSNLQPGTLAVPTLAVTETYLFEGPPQTGLVGCRIGEVAVICGPEAVLVRFPDGQAKMTKLSLDLGSLEIGEGAGSALLLDKKSGVLHCFDLTDGDLAWTADGLGTINQIQWTDSYGWFLDRPDSPDFDPAEAEIVLKVCGDSAFIQLEVRGDVTSPVPEMAIFMATPKGTGRNSWTLTQIPGVSYAYPGMMSASDDSIVILSSGDHGRELLVRDTETGEERWRLAIGGGTYYGEPMLVLPDRVLLDWGSFPSSSNTGLSCLDILTGEEKWRYDMPGGQLVSMESVGDKTLVLYRRLPGTGESHTDVTLLDEEGRQLWTYKAQSPAYTVRIDRVGGSITLLESTMSQLPGSGYWGTETTLRLSDGTPEAKPAGESGMPDLGNYRYIVLDNTLYRSPERFTGDFRTFKAVMRLTGPGVGIHDVVRHTSYLAGPDFVAVASWTANGVKVYILQHQPQPNPQ